MFLSALCIRRTLANFIIKVVPFVSALYPKREKWPGRPRVASLPPVTTACTLVHDIPRLLSPLKRFFGTQGRKADSPKPSTAEKEPGRKSSDGTGDRGKHLEGHSRRATSLAAVALVAALLLSTSSTPPKARGATLSSMGPGCGGRPDCGSNDIVLTFVAAATQCNDCCPLARARTTISASSGDGSCSLRRPMWQGKEAGTLGSCAPSRDPGSEIPRQTGGDEKADSVVDGPTDGGCGCWERVCAVLCSAMELHDNEQDCDRSTQVADDPPQCVRGTRPAKKQPGPAPTSGRGKDAQHVAVCKATQVHGSVSGGGRTVQGANNTACQLCAEDGWYTKEKQAEVDRHFVGLWSHVQAAAWHVNACLCILGFTGRRSGDGMDGALEPLRLNPAIALELYRTRRKRRRRRCMLRDTNQRDEQQTQRRHQRQESAANKLNGVKVSRDRFTAGVSTTTFTACPSHRIGVEDGSTGADVEGQESLWQHRRACGVTPGFEHDCPWTRRVRMVLKAAGVASSE